MRPKRVLAILRSPHIDGATATMLNHSICEAEKAGRNGWQNDIWRTS